MKLKTTVLKNGLQFGRIFFRNEIETCRGVIKNHVTRNCDFTKNNLIEQLDSGFDEVSGKTCVKIIAKMRKIEDEFWTEDLKFDAQKLG